MQFLQSKVAERLLSDDYAETDSKGAELFPLVFFKRRIVEERLC